MGPSPRTTLRRFVQWCAIAWMLSIDSARADQTESQRAVARELGMVGMEAYFAKDYARAANKLDRAYRLFSTPTLGLWSGRALIQINQWVRAAERLREAQLASAAVGDNAAQRQAQADAAEELKTLEPRIPRLTITIDGAAVEEVTLSIDQQPVAAAPIGNAQLVDPGHHSVVGQFRNQRVEVEVSLEPSESQVALLAFKPEAQLAAEAHTPPSAPSPAAAATELRATSANQAELAPETTLKPMRVAAIASFSLGGAGLATSLVLTWLASNKLDACAKRGGEYYCADSEANAYESYRGVATATFYAGAAFAGAGLVLWLLDGSSDTPQPLRVSASPLGAELSIKF